MIQRLLKIEAFLLMEKLYNQLRHQKKRVDSWFFKKLNTKLQHSKATYSCIDMTHILTKLGFDNDMNRKCQKLSITQFRKYLCSGSFKCSKNLQAKKSSLEKNGIFSKI